MPVVRSKVVSSRTEYNRPDKLVKTLGLRDFYEKRNKILVIRGCGGLGDILMHRMMFEDFKLLKPDTELHFACPKQYHEAVKDHPYLDCLLDSLEVQRHDYIVSYNTTTACGRYEMKLAPYSGKHRSDIWANHCGLELTKHDMHFRLTDEEKQEGLRLIESKRDREGPCVLLAPVSAMFNKNLLPQQVEGLVKGLRERGCYVLGIHNTPLYEFIKNDVPMLHGVKLRQWLGVINQADYVISVDTSAFHCAGGMGKPLVGVFTFADGKVYGKYFDFFLVQRHRDFDPTWTCGPCYNWGACPKTKLNPKPCLTEITADMILEKADLMLRKWPVSNK